MTKLGPLSEGVWTHGANAAAYDPYASADEPVGHRVGAKAQVFHRVHFTLDSMIAAIRDDL